MPIIQNLTLVNADRKKVWDKCHETNLGHYLFHIGITAQVTAVASFFCTFYAAAKLMR